MPDLSPPGSDEASASSSSSGAVAPVDPVWAKEPDAKPGVGRLPKLELKWSYDSDDEEEEDGENLLFPPSGMVYVGPKRGAVKMSDCHNSAVATGAGGQQVKSLSIPDSDSLYLAYWVHKL